MAEVRFTADELAEMQDLETELSGTLWERLDAAEGLPAESRRELFAHYRDALSRAIQIALLTRALFEGAVDRGLTTDNRDAEQLVYYDLEELFDAKTSVEEVERLWELWGNKWGDPLMEVLNELPRRVLRHKLSVVE